jgi:hypothetical protein
LEGANILVPKIGGSDQKIAGQYTPFPKERHGKESTLHIPFITIRKTVTGVLTFLSYSFHQNEENAMV